MMMHPISSKGRPRLRHEPVSSSSLGGLERPIPPKDTSSLRSSISDINKPLPPTPLGTTKEDRTFSNYSIDLEEIVDLYLTSNPSPYNLFSAACRSLQTLSFDYALPSPSPLGQDAKFSISESFLPDIYPLEIPAVRYSSKSQYAATRYRYSTPTLRSPSITQTTARNFDYNRGIPETDIAKVYRDTLLPAPFTPISIKSPGLFGKSIPLRGPRASDLPSLEKTPDINPRHSSGLMICSEESPRAESRLSMESSYVNDDHKDDFVDLRAQLNSFSWDQGPVELPESRLTHHSEFSHRGSTMSSVSELSTSLRLRPAPARYYTHDPYQNYSNNVSVSSISDSMTRTDTSSRNSPIPPNWSPILKPSNPNISKIPRSERSPAIGLSPYQLMGPKAWKKEDIKDSKSKKGLFGRRRNGAKLPPNELESLILDPLESSNTVESRPVSPNSLADPFGLQSDIRNGTHSTSEIDRSSPSHKTSRKNSSIFSKMSPLRSTTTGSNKNTAPSYIEKQEKTQSWIAARKQKAMKEKHEAWREDVKRKITVVSVRDSMGLSQNLGLLGDGPNSAFSDSTASHPGWFTPPSKPQTPYFERTTDDPGFNPVPNSTDSTHGDWI